MKITHIETIRIDEKPQIIWVNIHTDKGIIGLGETWYAPTVVESAIHDHFGPLLIGKDPRKVELHWNSMFQVLRCSAQKPMLKILGGPQVVIRDFTYFGYGLFH